MSVRALRRGSIAASRVTAPSTTNVLTLPGTSGNYASTPDSAAASVTSDIDIRAKVSLTAWNSAQEQTFVGKYGASGQRSYIFRKVAGTTGLEFLFSNNGTTVINPVSTAVTGFANGSVNWVRVTWNNTTDQAIFYTSADGSSWTQLGAAVAAAATGIFDSTAVLEIGSAISGTSNPMAGNMYYAEVRSGIGGTVVASFDATAVTKLGTRNPTTVPVGGTAGGNWTVNGSAWDWTAV